MENKFRVVELKINFKFENIESEVDSDDLACEDYEEIPCYLDEHSTTIRCTFETEQEAAKFSAYFDNTKWDKTHVIITLDDCFVDDIIPGLQQVLAIIKQIATIDTLKVTMQEILYLLHGAGQEQDEFEIEYDVENQVFSGDTDASIDYLDVTMQELVGLLL